MWEDKEFSREVKELEVLDLLFFNNINKPWGAHVWLYIWNNMVIHNTNKTGKVEIWDLDNFNNYEEYKVLLWAKRFSINK